jgi:hypothetical protein
MENHEQSLLSASLKSPWPCKRLRDATTTHPTTTQKETTMSQPILQEIPPAARLMEIIFSPVPAQALSVAAKLGVADLLKDQAKSADELAQALGVQARPLYRVLRALASTGVFAEDTEGRFHLTPLAEPLRSDAPDSVRDFAIYFGDDWHRRVWGELGYSVDTGLSAFEKVYGKPFFDYLAENPEPARVFNNAMTSHSASDSAAVVKAYDFTGINKLVDVGGGHGALIAAILANNPQMKGVLFDAPSVVAGASDVLAEHDVSERCEVVGGNFFTSVPEGGDAYIMRHIIHDWDDERSLTILKNCHQAMAENGRLLVVEIVITEGNTPSFGKFLDLAMLVLVNSFERTAAEYGALFAQAGFKLTRIVPTPSAYSVLEAVRVK